MSAVVQLQNIHKVYDSSEVKVHAVRGVSLDIQRGDFIAVMGASGSGKSTLMNLIGCLDRQYAQQGNLVAAAPSKQFVQWYV